MMGWKYGTPSRSTIRNWVLGCGLYVLDCSTAKSGNYAGIIDESIQIGREKLLLLLGIKEQEDRSQCVPLGIDDVEVLGIEVQTSWDSNDVSEFIERHDQKHPEMNLKYIISDGGSVLLSALKKLGIHQVADCTHIMMNIVKRLFGKDEGLAAFYSAAGQLRQKILLTDIGHLAPPSLRKKDKFMRIFILTDWYDRIMSNWDNLPKEAKEKLDFVKNAEGLMERMKKIRELVGITAKLFKSSGISSYTCELWEKKIKDCCDLDKLTSNEEYFIQSIRKYLEKHSVMASKFQRLLCCSDIIESIFGRYKNKGGVKVISADVLSICLYSKKINTRFVIEALSKTQQKDIELWQQKYTCDNRFSILNRMNRELKSVSSIT